MDKIKFYLTSVFIALASLSGSKLALLFLSLALVADFVTGCWASWIECKQKEIQASVYFIESRKIRASFSKMITYGLLIAISWFLYVLFFDVLIGIPYSTKQFSLVELTIGLCISVELWSMIENMKRAGFDLIAKVQNIIKNAWQLFREVKGGGQ